MNTHKHMLRQNGFSEEERRLLGFAAGTPDVPDPSIDTTSAAPTKDPDAGKDAVDTTTADPDAAAANGVDAADHVSSKQQEKIQQAETSELMMRYGMDQQTATTLYNTIKDKPENDVQKLLSAMDAIDPQSQKALVALLQKYPDGEKHLSSIFSRDWKGYHSATDIILNAPNAQHLIDTGVSDADLSEKGKSYLDNYRSLTQQERNFLLDMNTMVDGISRAAPAAEINGPALRQAAEQQLGDLMKSTDGMDKFDVQIKMAQAMISHGVSVVEKDNKLEVSAPQNNTDVTLNKIVGIFLLVAALYNKVKAKIDTAVKAGEDPATAEKPADTPDAGKADRAELKKQLEDKPFDDLKNEKENAKTAANDAIETDPPGDLRQREKTAEDAIHPLEGEVAVLKSKLNTADEADKPDIQKELTAKETELQNAQKEVEEVKKAINDKEAEMKKLEAEIKELDAMKEEAEKAVTDTKDTVNRTTGMIDTLLSKDSDHDLKKVNEALKKLKFATNKTLDVTVTEGSDEMYAAITSAKTLDVKAGDPALSVSGTDKILQNPQAFRELLTNIEVKAQEEIKKT